MNNSTYLYKIFNYDIYIFQIIYYIVISSETVNI